MTPQEYISAIKHENVPRLTMKRHFSALGPLFKYLIEGANPSYGFTFPKRGRQNQKRQMWEGEKLRRLFASPVWTGCQSEGRRAASGSLVLKDDKHWLPLMALWGRYRGREA